ncbi:hypothetical protein SLEP1_g46403 [Rubroshorea leprosula]|uniref:Uncharacterized protein n=1 Tax=Rubroshorea leprosula TaxID=152421 RepID=A0AAV5LNV9_9ROSI|nr:hypothetical protein SLEP1_g46403 [Rubroshorea leprosula]
MERGLRAVGRHQRHQLLQGGTGSNLKEVHFILKHKTSRLNK